jgi:hypothetical protein
MPTKKGKSTKGSGRQAPARPAAADRSLSALLQTGSVDRIVPDVAHRVEDGRRQYVNEALVAARAELEILEEERKHLEKDEAADPRRRQRIERLLAAVDQDVQMLHATSVEIKNAVEVTRGAWTVIGRVLKRRGDPAEKATVEFVGDNGEPVKELGRLPVDAEGRVRHVYPPEIVERLVKRQVTVSAAARAESRALVVDNVRVPVTPDAVHQFDLRLDSSD